MQENQLYLSPLETQLNCTAGDVFRNLFTKKEGETEDEEQSYYNHGHDNDHGGQDEEEDDQLGDWYLMRESGRQLVNYSWNCSIVL